MGGVVGVSDTNDGSILIFSEPVERFILSQ